MTLSLTCPKCDSSLGEGLDLRKSSCHNCGYVDYSPEPEAQPKKAALPEAAGPAEESAPAKTTASKVKK